MPVDGFCSITAYNAVGYMQKSETNAVSLNNITATQDTDGGYTINFGGNPNASNYLEIFRGWKCAVRLYPARPEVFDGTWKFSEAQPVQ